MRSGQFLERESMKVNCMRVAFCQVTVYVVNLTSTAAGGPGGRCARRPASTNVHGDPNYISQTEKTWKIFRNRTEYYREIYRLRIHK